MMWDFDEIEKLLSIVYYFVSKIRTFLGCRCYNYDIARLK